MKAYIKQNYNDKTYAEMAEETGATFNVISKYVGELIKEGEVERKYKRWSEAEDNYLINKYDTTPKKELAEILGVSTQTLRDRYYKLKKGLAGKTKKRMGKIATKEKKKAKEDAIFINKRYAAAIAQPFETPGLKLDELKVKKGHKYSIGHFEGELIQIADRHCVFRDKRGRCESFLKVDLLLGKFKEVN